MAVSQRSNWPHLQYVLKGNARSQPGSTRRRLLITPAIMQQLLTACPIAFPIEFEAELLWAACCIAYFEFLRSGEFTVPDATAIPAICAADVATDLHTSPSFMKIRLRKAKTDQLGNGVDIFLGTTGTPLCPVKAVLRYLAVCPKTGGALLVHADGSPLLRDQFVKMVKKCLRTANIDDSDYSGHSFRIGAATAAAAAGVPAHFIKMLKMGK